MEKVIISLSSIILGSFITYLFSIRINQKFVLKEARTNFHIAMLPLVYALKNGDIQLRDFIESQIPNQEVAFLRLVSLTPKRNRISLYKAWKDYKHPDSDGLYKDEPLELYGRCSHLEHNEIVKDLENKINKMFKYANITS